MKRQHVAFCVPSLGRVTMDWAAAMSNIRRPMNVGLIKMFLLGRPVAEARNECVQRALNVEAQNPDNEVSHIFWLDDDVIVPATALVALMLRRKPIVSGVYFSKTQPAEPLIFDGFLGGTAEFRPGEFRECWGHGMGLTLVELEVYRRLRDETDLGVDENGNPAWYVTGGVAEMDDGPANFTTEDFYFLNAAHKLGIPSFVDQSMDAFGIHIDLATLQGYPANQFEEYKTKGSMTWATSEGDVVWEAVKY